MDNLFKNQLIKIGACKESIEWIEDKTLREAWDACKRGDWLLWLYEKSINYDERLAVLAAAHCCERIRFYVSEDLQYAIDVAINYGRGNISKEEFDGSWWYNSEEIKNSAEDAVYSLYYEKIDKWKDLNSVPICIANYFEAISRFHDNENYHVSMEKSAEICREFLPIPVL